MTKLLTIEGVSERTLASVNTLRYWRHNGSGPPSFKLGRRVVYRENDVDEWIKSQAAAQGVA